jgi:hypothetical protein
MTACWIEKPRAGAERCVDSDGTVVDRKVSQMIRTKRWGTRLSEKLVRNGRVGCCAGVNRRCEEDLCLCRKPNGNTSRRYGSSNRTDKPCCRRHREQGCVCYWGGNVGSERCCGVEFQQGRTGAPRIWRHTATSTTWTGVQADKTKALTGLVTRSCVMPGTKMNTLQSGHQVTNEMG